MKLNCKRFVSALLATVLLFLGRAAITSLPIRALSPNGRLAIDVSINTDKQPTYVITLDGKKLVEESRMGFEGRTTFSNGIASYTISQIDEAYTMPHGKCSTYRDYCTLLSVVYDGPGTSRDMTMEFRLYNDAVAFRYIMEQGNLTTFCGEDTEFNLTDMKQVLALSYSNDYTWYYYQHPWADLTNEKGYNEPLLVQRKTDDICILLTEAANFGETSACSIVRGTQEGQLRLQTISNSETNPSDARAFARKFVIN